MYNCITVYIGKYVKQSQKSTTARKTTQHTQAANKQTNAKRNYHTCSKHT